MIVDYYTIGNTFKKLIKRRYTAHNYVQPNLGSALPN
jgi:hypothetical protein